MKEGYKTVTCTDSASIQKESRTEMRKLQPIKVLQEEQNYDHMPERCLGPRASELSSVLACKRSVMIQEQYACCAGWEMACLVQDREGHVAYDVRAVDDQRVPLFEADDLVAC